MTYWYLPHYQVLDRKKYRGKGRPRKIDYCDIYETLGYFTPPEMKIEELSNGDWQYTIHYEIVPKDYVYVMSRGDGV